MKWPIALALPTIALALAGCTCPTSQVTWHDADLYFATPGNGSLPAWWTDAGPQAEPMPLQDDALDGSWGEYRLESVTQGEARVGRTFSLVGREVRAQYGNEAAFAQDQVGLPAFLRMLGVPGDHVPALRDQMAQNQSGVLQDVRSGGAREYRYAARLPDVAPGAQPAWDALAGMAQVPDGDEDLGHATLARDGWAFRFAIPVREGGTEGAEYRVDADGEAVLLAHTFSKDDGDRDDLVRWTQEQLRTAGLPAADAKAMQAQVGGC